MHWDQLEAEPLASISLIGKFNVYQAATGPASLSSRKAKQLIAFLALSRNMRASRASIASELWPESDAAHSRGALRATLAALRRELGAGFAPLFEADSLTVGLKRAQVDLINFERRLDNSPTLDEIRAMVLTCEDGLAFEISDGNSTAAGWATDAVRRFQDVYVQLLERLCLMEQGERRIRAAKQLVGADPVREQSHRLLMEVYAAEGEIGLALRQFDECQNILWREFGVRVSERTLGLRKQLLESGVRVDSNTESPRISAALNLDENAVSIAITPFKSTSADEAERYLAEGLTNEVISALTRFRGLVVMASSTSFAAQVRTPAALEAGRMLKVRYVTEGNVRVAQRRLKISVRLIDTTTGRETWAERYEGVFDEMQDFESEIAKTIATHLEVKVSSAVAHARRRRTTRNFPAYENVQRARELLGHYNIEEARRMLMLALQAAPDFAQAHAWLSFCNWSAFQIGLEEKNLEQAVSCGLEAVNLDPEDALCHAFLSLACLFNRDFVRAGHHSDLAMQLNPNDSQVLSTRADYLYRAGWAEEGIALLKRQLRFDPIPQPYYWESRSLAHWVAGQYHESLSCLEKVSQLQWWDHCYRAYNLHSLGFIDDARTAVRKAITCKPDATIGQLLRSEPFADAEISLRLAGALKKSGMPE